MQTFPKVFPEVKVKVLNKDRMQPGLTLCNLYNEILGVPIMAIVLDPEGNVYWWYEHGNVLDARGDIDIRTVPEGILIGGTNFQTREKPVPPVLVSWRRKVLWTGKIVNHHHIHRTPEGNYIFLIAEERYFKHLNTSLVGDVIIEYDPQSDCVVWEWHIFDHVTPKKVRRRDWSHCNTIEPDPRDGSLYLSARNLNSIL
ncbi:unnamed protein product, partial [marine sediment metagenome]